MRTLENQIHELDYSSVMLRYLIHLLAKHQNCVCGTDRLCSACLGQLLHGKHEGKINDENGSSLICLLAK